MPCKGSTKILKYQSSCMEMQQMWNMICMIILVIVEVTRIVTKGLKKIWKLVNKFFFFLLNAVYAMAILDLISQVHLPSSVNMLPKYLKHFTFFSRFWSIIIVTGAI
jgi:hypothetical protein